jgi:uncharacterized membrane protein
MSQNTSATTAPEGADPNVLFDAVITPHRSLRPRGFAVVMTVMGAAGFACGIAFMAAGAWPVVGFMALAVALVYLAFRINYSAARAVEHVKLTRNELTIQRLDRRGRGIEIAIQPYWLQVEVADSHGAAEIRLRSHGRTYTVGSFLSPAERIDFADALREALAVLRRPAHLDGTGGSGTAGA